MDEIDDMSDIPTVATTYDNGLTNRAIVDWLLTLLYTLFTVNLFD